jgi:hypothetical protein
MILNPPPARSSGVHYVCTGVAVVAGAAENIMGGGGGGGVKRRKNTAWWKGTGLCKRARGPRREEVVPALPRCPSAARARLAASA